MSGSSGMMSRENGATLPSERQWVIQGAAVLIGHGPRDKACSWGIRPCQNEPLQLRGVPEQEHRRREKPLTRHTFVNRGAAVRGPRSPLPPTPGSVVLSRLHFAAPDPPEHDGAWASLWPQTSGQPKGRGGICEGNERLGVKAR